MEAPLWGSQPWGLHPRKMSIIYILVIIKRSSITYNQLYCVYFSLMSVFPGNMGLLFSIQGHLWGAYPPLKRLSLVFLNHRDLYYMHSISCGTLFTYPRPRAYPGFLPGGGANFDKNIFQISLIVGLFHYLSDI